MLSMELNTTTIVEDTDRAIAAATHLTEMDRGAVAVLRQLARPVATAHDLREHALRYAEEHDLRPPAVDNVSVPTYLKFCESLGLTPSGRAKLEPKGQSGDDGKLSGLRTAASRRAA